jgi:3-hydroxyacyl-CoA dehydrogenase, NAD binding domain
VGVFKDGRKTVMGKSIHFGSPLIAFVVMSSIALAQEPSQPPPTTDHSAHHGQTGQPSGQPTMGGQMMGDMMDQGMMGQQMMGSGQPMMGCPMMAGMMQGGRGPGMMQSGMGAVFGSRVTPMMNLSAEDVRGYLDAQLERLNNKRLKVGDVKSEDGTITADFVQENAPEQPDLKINLFADMDDSTPPDSIIASSSSSITPSVIQSKCKRPERVLVGHPINPPHIIPLVEVVGGTKTSPDAIQQALAFYASIGKKPIHLRNEDFLTPIAHKVTDARSPLLA